MEYLNKDEELSAGQVKHQPDLVRRRKLLADQVKGQQLEMNFKVLANQNYGQPFELNIGEGLKSCRPTKSEGQPNLA